jgi:hypothetical protein
MLTDTNQASQQWRCILVACDDLLRQGQCGPDVLRLASELEPLIGVLLQCVSSQCTQIHLYTERCTEAMRVTTPQLYQRLYIDAYAMLDRGQQTVVNDGAARHNVTLDPEGCFNHIQCDGPVVLTLPSDNESLYKYASHSSLNTISNVRSKVDALWQSYDTECESLMTVLAQPLEGLEKMQEANTNVTQQMSLLQGVLNRLYNESQHINVLNIYSQSVELMRQLAALQKEVRTQTSNTTMWRDNVLVRLCESAQLLQRVTRPYEQTQSHCNGSVERSQITIF